jgi:hypothetical protein
VIGISDGELIAGEIPGKQLRMVQAWIVTHSEELMVNWDLAVNEDEPFRIAPLLRVEYGNRCRQTLAIF